MVTTPTLIAIGFLAVVVLFTIALVRLSISNDAHSPYALHTNEADTDTDDTA